MTDQVASDEAKLRVAISALESIQRKRNAVAQGLELCAGDFHRAMKHEGTDWHRCKDPACIRSSIILINNKKETT